MNFEKRPNTRGGVVEYDAISKASSAYVGKHNTSKRQRHSSAQSKTLKLSQNSKTFYPDAYFKRVGYQKSDASSRVDALGQRVRDRFNEELEFEEPKARGGLHQRTLKQLKASNQKQLAGSAAAVSRKSADIWSDKRLSLAKKSLKVDNENNKFNTIEKDAGDKESVITKDRLQKFNEIQGTVAGNVEDEIEAAEAAKNAEIVDDDLERADDPAAEYQAEAVAEEEEKDEVKSL